VRERIVIQQRVRAILDAHEIRYAVIGAVALAARGAPRSTYDFDVLTTDKRVFSQELWSDLVRDRVPVDIRKGDFDDPLGGVIRIGPPSEQVDVVVGKWRWEHRAVESAEMADVQGIPMRVAIASDLILMKLNAGGYQDRMDVHALLEVGPRDQLIADVESKLGDLPSTAEKDARDLWQTILSES
jgi:hypothetical protein